jgi:L-malate glycosyltransferase
MEKIKVLHIVLSLEIGGLEQVVLNLVRNLDRKRFEPAVACLNERGALADELLKLGIKVIQVNPMSARFSFLFPMELVKIIKQEKVDIAHSHSGCWYKSVRAASLAKIQPTIHTEHGRLIPDSLQARWLDRFYTKYTTRVVAVSDSLRDYLIYQIKIPASKIEVIYNGVPDIKLAVSIDSIPLLEGNGSIPIIGTIGRLAPVKDYSTLLLAMRQVVDEVRPAKLVIIGDGPERNRLEQLTEKLGITSNVNFLGARRDLANLYGNFTVFALSSISEGTSMSILEAMASGKPVVATAVGGNTSLVQEGKTGHLVPPKQPELLAKALLNLIRNKTIAQNMGNAGRERYLTYFTATQMARNYELLYERMLSERRPNIIEPQ